MKNKEYENLEHYSGVTQRPKETKTSYRVDWWMGDTFEVLDRETNQQIFKGSLSDCEAFIRLDKGGYFKH